MQICFDVTRGGGLVKFAIFGAKSTALGICLAIRKIYPELKIETFLVSSLENNPMYLAGLPVQEISSFADKEIRILIGTPEDLHEKIIHSLEIHGFMHWVCINSYQESELMERYFYELGLFPSIHKVPIGNIRAVLKIYQAKHCKDKPVKHFYSLPDWIVPIQAGAADLSRGGNTEADCTGDNISSKNANYCELTVLYWLWKNCLQISQGKGSDAIQPASRETEYYGLFHYRRILDIRDHDLLRMTKNQIDVILPYPTIHEPSIYEHHVRYIQEKDWEAVMDVLAELQPEYAEAFSEILEQPYLYNYNILIAKRQILSDYCACLFPILFQVEERTDSKEKKRMDRYIGYIGENLLTLYFFYHKDTMNILHSGRIMLT